MRPCPWAVSGITCASRYRSTTTITTWIRFWRFSRSAVSRSPRCFAGLLGKSIQEAVDVLLGVIHRRRHPQLVPRFGLPFADLGGDVGLSELGARANGIFDHEPQDRGFIIFRGNAGITQTRDLPP